MLGNQRSILKIDNQPEGSRLQGTPHWGCSVEVGLGGGVGGWEGWPREKGPEALLGGQEMKM